MLSERDRVLRGVLGWNLLLFGSGLTPILKDFLVNSVLTLPHASCYGAAAPTETAPVWSALC